MREWLPIAVPDLSHSKDETVFWIFAHALIGSKQTGMGLAVKHMSLYPATRMQSLT